MAWHSNCRVQRQKMQQPGTRCRKTLCLLRLVQTVARISARRACVLHSLEHYYAPRRGGLVFERNGSTGRLPSASRTSSASSAVPPPTQTRAKQAALPDRIAKLQAVAFSGKQTGTTQGRVKALEEDVHGEPQAGPISARLAVLEEQHGVWGICKANSRR
jgi:hypothetical protein